MGLLHPEWVGCVCHGLQVRFRALLHMGAGGLDGRGYSTAIHALAMLGYKPGERWAAAFFGGSAALLARQVRPMAAVSRYLLLLCFPYWCGQWLLSHGALVLVVWLMVARLCK